MLKNDWLFKAKEQKIEMKTKDNHTSNTGVSC